MRVLSWLLLVAAAAVGVWIWRHTAVVEGKNSQSSESKQVIRANILPVEKTNSAASPLLLPVSTSPAPVPSLPTNPPPSQPSARLPANDRILEAQIVLARQGISPGSLDGVLGSQTRAALIAFQEKQKLTPTGELDDDTRPLLAASEPLFTNYTVTAEDLARLQPLGTNWLSKSQQSRMDYETELELVAEKSRSRPNLIRRLNRDMDWSNVVAGMTLTVPNMEKPPARQRAAFIRISLAGKILQAFDANTNLLAHFPCSIARHVEKRPVGELHVTVIAPNPNYTFDPANFPESAEARDLGRKLVLQPGPNNPVGIAWIGLDRSGYGIHGTPQPEFVGRTESHGCFRLANWNAEQLLQMVTVGTPVYVEP